MESRFKLYTSSWPRLDFFVLNFFSILSDLPLTREIDTKKLSNFEKLQFLNDRIDQNTNFAKWRLFLIIVNFIIQK